MDLMSHPVFIHETKPTTACRSEEVFLQQTHFQLGIRAEQCQ